MSQDIFQVCLFLFIMRYIPEKGVTYVYLIQLDGVQNFTYVYRIPSFRSQRKRMRMWEIHFYPVQMRGKSCVLPIRVPNLSPTLDKNLASMGPGILSSIGVGVWRKALEAYPDSNTTLDTFQSSSMCFLCWDGNLLILLYSDCGATRHCGLQMFWDLVVRIANRMVALVKARKDPTILKTLRI